MEALFKNKFPTSENSTALKKLAVLKNSGRKNNLLVSITTCPRDLKKIIIPRTVVDKRK
jgi:hypothetical protein